MRDEQIRIGEQLVPDLFQVETAEDHEGKISVLIANRQNCGDRIKNTNVCG
jgi:hypothetical protein